jgi:hypothetical protein
MHVSLTFGRAEPFPPGTPAPDLTAVFTPLDGQGEGGRLAVWAADAPGLPPSDIEVAYAGAGRIFGDYEAQRQRMQARIGDEAMIAPAQGGRPYLALWRVTGKVAPEEVNLEHQKNSARVFQRVICAIPLRPAGTEGGPKMVAYLYEATDEADFKRLYEQDAAVRYGVVESTPYKAEVTYSG